MSDDGTTTPSTDTKFVFGRLGYELGTQDATDVLDSGETLRDFATRKLAEQKKSGDID